MRLVAFGHRSRAGKDTCADILVKERGFTRDAFANPLKECAKLICNWTEQHTNGDLKEVEDPFWGFSPRFFMRRFGTEVGRSIRPDIWVKCMEMTLKYCQESDTDVVLTDLRFPNEMDLVRRMGGICVKVTRPGLTPLVMPTRFNRIFRKSKISHPSETSLEGAKYDYVIENKGTLEELAEIVRRIPLKHHWENLRQ